MITFMICVSLSYFIGSIPVGYILTWLYLKQDVRKVGSGNIGATNVFRTGKPLLGAFTFLGDALKGSLAVYLTWEALQSTPYQQVSTLAALLFVVLGHLFPVWLRFKGGKGVATFAGGCFILFPWMTLCLLALWGGIFALSRISSLSSLLAVGISPFLLWWASPSFVFFGEFSSEKIILFLLCCALIIAKHHANIRRLLSKKELSFSLETSLKKENPPKKTK